MHFYHACQGKSVGSYQVGAYNLISMSKIRSLGLQCKISSICVKIQLPFLANILYFALVSKFRTFLLGGVQKRNTIGATPMLGPSRGSKEQQPLDTQGLGHKNRSKELFIHNTTFIWVRVWLEKEKKRKKEKEGTGGAARFFFFSWWVLCGKWNFFMLGVPPFEYKGEGFWLWTWLCNGRTTIIGMRTTKKCTSRLNQYSKYCIHSPCLCWRRLCRRRSHSWTKVESIADCSTSR